MPTSAGPRPAPDRADRGAVYWIVNSMVEGLPVAGAARELAPTWNDPSLPGWALVVLDNRVSTVVL